jgi:hypothetical protein
VGRKSAKAVPVARKSARTFTMPVPWKKEMQRRMAFAESWAQSGRLAMGIPETHALDPTTWEFRPPKEVPDGQ